MAALRSTWALAAVAGLLAVGSRLWLIARVPDNYSFDGYQRWGGREHLLVQDWLPATQGLIHLTQALGGGIIATRVVLGLVASVGAVALVLVARRLGGVAAGWFALPAVVFAPYLAWSVAMYQEGTWLTLVLGSFALALAARSLGARGWLLLADLLAGAAALARYEGWVYAALYMAWRRDPRALVAAWGMAGWLFLREVLHVQGYAASPTDFADWVGITDRFDLAVLGQSLTRAWWQFWHTGGGAMTTLGAVGAVAAVRARRDGALTFSLLAASQLAITACWAVGLETFTYRMQAGVGPLVCVLAAVAAGAAWQRWRRLWLRAVLVAGALFASVRSVQIAVWMADRSVASVRWERDLVHQMEACGGCRFEVIPRRGLGTRDRHDGCEIVQGMSESMAGRDFTCATWEGWPTVAPTHRATWKDGTYEIEPL